jgi:N-acetylmuramoyl-L-alanine amidase
MKYFWILDAGHGGVDENGDYTTCPNWERNNPQTWHKMHVHPAGPIFEGEFNRLVVEAIVMMLDEKGIDSHVLCPGSEDISLKERVKETNDLYKNHKNAIFVSVHGNAFNGNAKGFEVFTSKGLTRSDAMADVFAIQMSKMFPKRVMRWDLTDKDKDKEANFYVLKHTDCPAILTENFFFDSPEDAKLMMSIEGVLNIAKAHVNAILKIESSEKQY